MEEEQFYLVHIWTLKFFVGALQDTQYIIWLQACIKEKVGHEENEDVT